MKLLQNLAKTGILYAAKRNLNRDVRIINYFSVIISVGCVLLATTRYILAATNDKININVSENKDFFVAAALAFLPAICARYGKIGLARLLVSWVPPLVITGLYAIHGRRNNGLLSISEFDSLYLFLLCTTPVPYLLGSSRKKGFALSLLLPMVFIIFCDVILKLLGVTHVSQSPPADGIEIYRMRAFIACFLLNGCCIAIKKIVDKQDMINDALIEKLEEQNILINKNAAEKINESRNKYQLLFEQAPYAIILLNAKKQFEKVNPRASTMFGYTKEEFFRIAIEEIKALKENVNTYQGDFLNNPGNSPMEIILKRKDGSSFPAEVHGKKLPDNNYQLFVKDITVRKKAEHDLKETEEKFRALVEKSLAGVYIIQNKKFSYVNPQFAKIFGYSQSELQQKPVSFLTIPEHKKIDQSEYKNMLRTKKYIQLEKIGRKKDGNLVNVEILDCVTILNGEPAVIGTLIDVTEKRRLEREMTKQKEHERKKIMRAMLKAQEQERGRLGRELHDNINQILASAILYISMASGNEENTKAHINNSKELLVSAINEIRALSHGLVTPHSQLKLDEHITCLAEKIRLTSALELNICYDADESLLRSDLKLNVFRIVQEQLNNILKHADARTVVIEIKTDSDYLKIRISDDGKGFNTDGKRNGIGLSNIINRIESFNGQLQLNSSPGNGCSLTMQIPLNQNYTPVNTMLEVLV